MFSYPEDATVWNEATRDAYGRKTWTRTEIKCRIAYKQEKFTDSNGDQTISKAVCYSDNAALALDAKIYFGVSVSVDPVDGADDIRAISATPSATTARKAWL